MMKLCSYFPLPGFSRKCDIAALFVLFVVSCGFEVYVTFLFCCSLFYVLCVVLSVFCFKMHKESDFDEMAAWLDERVSSTLRL